MKRREFLIGTAATLAALPAAAALSFEEPTQRVWRDHEFDCADWICRHYGFDSLTVHQEAGLHLLYTGLDFKSRWPRGSGKTAIIHGYLLYKQFIVKDRIDRNLICTNQGNLMQNYFDYKRSMEDARPQNENIISIEISLLNIKADSTIKSLSIKGNLSTVYFSAGPYISQQKIYYISQQKIYDIIW